MIVTRTGHVYDKGVCLGILHQPLFKKGWQLLDPQLQGLVLRTAISKHALLVSLGYDGPVIRRWK